ncbi:protein LURP-one-related 15-like [Punica granatum]|uniref:Uncharacterized protein n=2 Tax=Punica granatum TaxID=22663 RepID=A0A218W2T0_PUNGR|nr:protein LURP-one-related 15-like [Punica granatum]OWM67075.1 hypothetical protein CDL15_Pgr000527 [Punica granatum]PKI32447.1 hypothetical protein CRG98_047156 [Punica granatum]
MAKSLMMAAESSYPAMARPVAVVSSAFCVPYVVDLTIVRKLIAVTDGNFLVTDVDDNTVFRVRGAHFSFHDRRVLLDAAGHPVATLRQKKLTAHRRWQVFRGESSDSEDLLFSAKKSSLIQYKTELDVFLAANTKEDVPNFKVEGSWLERSCTIYAGDSSMVIAQMHTKHTVQKVVLGKDTFSVTVYPNIDRAFITALIVILEEINEDKDNDD